LIRLCGIVRHALPPLIAGRRIGRVFVQKTLALAGRGPVTGGLAAGIAFALGLSATGIACENDALGFLLGVCSVCATAT
jgi:hypothetical protein